MLVMKFGGTSVECADSIRRVARIVGERLSSHPVVIVSALARVTDQLQSLGSLSKAGYKDQALLLAEGIEKRHAEVARQLLGSKAVDFLDRMSPSFQDL